LRERRVVQRDRPSGPIALKRRPAAKSQPFWPWMHPPVLPIIQMSHRGGGIARAGAEGSVHPAKIF
jgi:hypothetical protein